MSRWTCLNFPAKDPGQSLTVAAVQNSLNYCYGYSLANPHVLATTCTLASGDRAVTATPTANAVYTMPDCVGPSGEAYTIAHPRTTSGCHWAM